MPQADRITENVAGVRERVAAAAAASGRSADDVTLVAVTKYVGPNVIRAVVGAGCTRLGESRPQQLWSRAAEIDDLRVEWHLIGHLQRNKVQRTLPLVAMIQSVDSLRLAAAINEAAAASGRITPILLEVHISDDASKHGFEPDELDRTLQDLAGLEHVRIGGLMCMAGLEGGLAGAQRDFAAVRRLRDRLRANCPPQIDLRELSMGMSGDYEVAIREGATIVRVGSALFEGVVE